jgi:hypothetical protein
VAPLLVTQAHAILAVDLAHVDTVFVSCLHPTAQNAHLVVHRA